MTKFLYCMRCKNGFQLEIQEIKTCECENVGGRYTDRVHAEVCAQNPDLARFLALINLEMILKTLKKNSLKSKTIKSGKNGRKVT